MILGSANSVILYSPEFAGIQPVTQPKDKSWALSISLV